MKPLPLILICLFICCSSTNPIDSVNSINSGRTDQENITYIYNIIEGKFSDSDIEYMDGWIIHIPNNVVDANIKVKSHPAEGWSELSSFDLKFVYYNFDIGLILIEDPNKILKDTYYRLIYISPKQNKLDLTTEDTLP